MTLGYILSECSVWLVIRLTWRRHHEQTSSVCICRTYVGIAACTTYIWALFQSKGIWDKGRMRTSPLSTGKKE